MTVCFKMLALLEIATHGDIVLFSLEKGAFHFVLGMLKNHYQKVVNV